MTKTSAVCAKDGIVETASKATARSTFIDVLSHVTGLRRAFRDSAVVIGIDTGAAITKMSVPTAAHSSFVLCDLVTRPTRT